MPKRPLKSTMRLQRNLSTGLPSDYHADQVIRAPIPGLVTRVFIKPGDRLEPGDPLFIIEAMKMRNTLRSRHPVTVAAVHAAAGRVVKSGDLLVEFVKSDKTE